MKDVYEFLDEKYPIKIGYSDIWVGDRNETDKQNKIRNEYRIGMVLSDTMTYHILNPNGLWDFYDRYYYFPSEEAYIEFKMRFL